MRLAPLAALLLFSTPAAAVQPCPQMAVGWALSSPPPLTAVLYDESQTLMYVVWNSVEPTAFFGVPRGIMQTISQAQSYLQAYNGYVYDKYPSLLLTEKTGCPITTEWGAYISTNGLMTPNFLSLQSALNGH